MRNLTETLDELVKKKMEIEQWKAAHPEAVEIVQLVEDYLKLFDGVYRQIQPPTIINPPYINPGIVNPAPLFPPGPPWVITNTDNTVATTAFPSATAVQHGWQDVKV